MTLDYSIIAFNALNILVLMTIPIEYFHCFVNSFSKNKYIDPIQLKHD